MEVLFFGVWCRPFYNYWSVPPENFQCDTYHDHLIVNLVFNVTSDLMMLAIPAPMLARSSLPLRKKIILCGIFSLGAFVIICAILSKFYSLSFPYGIEWVHWYVREASVAVMVANIPHCWLLLRRAFHLRAFLSNSTMHTRGESRFREGTDFGNRSTVGTGKPKRFSKGIPLSGSEERITKDDKKGNEDINLEIWKDVDVDVVVTDSPAAEEEDDEGPKGRRNGGTFFM